MGIGILGAGMSLRVREGVGVSDRPDMMAGEGRAGLCAHG